MKKLTLNILASAILALPIAAHSRTQDFLVCKEPPPESGGGATGMGRGCTIFSQSTMEAALQWRMEHDCEFWGHKNCRWIADTVCGVRILSGYTGCKRDYVFDFTPNETRIITAQTYSASNHGYATTIAHSTNLCPDGTLFDRDIFNTTDVHVNRGLDGCLPVVDRYWEGASCPAPGNPIEPLRGLKRQLENILTGPLPFDIQFKNVTQVPLADAEMAPFMVPDRGGVGELWSGSWHRRLVKQVNLASPLTDKPLLGILLSHGLGNWLSFEKRADGTFQSNMTSDAALGSLGGQYGLYDRLKGNLEVYAAGGEFVKQYGADGASYTPSYSMGVVAGVSPRAGLLISVADGFGRAIQFNYEQPEGVPEPRI